MDKDVVWQKTRTYYLNCADDMAVLSVKTALKHCVLVVYTVDLDGWSLGIQFDLSTQLLLYSKKSRGV